MQGTDQILTLNDANGNQPTNTDIAQGQNLPLVEPVWNMSILEGMKKTVVQHARLARRSRRILMPRGSTRCSAAPAEWGKVRFGGTMGRTLVPEGRGSGGLPASIDYGAFFWSCAHISF